jgi:hypothetical protein
MASPPAGMGRNRLCNHWDQLGCTQSYSSLFLVVELSLLLWAALEQKGLCIDY